MDVSALGTVWFLPLYFFLWLSLYSEPTHCADDQWRERTGSAVRFPCVVPCWLLLCGGQPSCVLSSPSGLWSEGKDCWILSKSFYVSDEMTIWCFLVFICYVTFIDFHMVNHSHIFSMKPNVIMVHGVFFVIYYWFDFQGKGYEFLLNFKGEPAAGVPYNKQEMIPPNRPCRLSVTLIPKPGREDRRERKGGATFLDEHRWCVCVGGVAGGRNRHRQNHQVRMQILGR